jgi:hypothetical protein
MGSNENTLNEIEEEMICYLLNVDDINYTMLCEPQVTRYKHASTQHMPNIVGLEKLNLIGEIISNEDSVHPMEFEQPILSEFPKRKFQPLRPATMEDELAKDTSYSK